MLASVFAYRKDGGSCHDLLDLVRRMMDAPYLLKLLGGLGLEGLGNRSGRVTQRRQLALLALLAGHDAPLTRDKLIGFLWPETPADRARHQLSDSVYIIRKELGEEAIVTIGDHLRLNPVIVASDLAGFRSALANEFYDDALASYGGPFLDGFFPDDSESFERWMADKREALKRQAARAAWELVERAQTTGDTHEAIRWAHRALEIVPEDERGICRLIRLQAGRGDRAGALRTFEAFATRLEAEMDIEPSEETQKLIASIREQRDADHERVVERPPTEPDRPVSTVETPARRSIQRATTRPEGQEALRWRRGIGVAVGLAAVAVLATWLVAPKSEGDPSSSATASVAVLPFEVRGEDLGVWREGMVDLVSTNIDVFPELRAVPSRTVLARWREAGANGPVDLTGALDVARRTHAHYAVIGSVIGTREGLRIRGELFDLQTGAKVGEAVTEGPPDSIFAIVDRLSVALMDPLLSSSYSGRWPRLASFTTSSPTALKAFLEGETLLRTGQYQPAIEAYKRAIEADSTFALAYYRLSESYTWTTSGEESREPARLAAHYADRLPEREARLVRAWNLTMEGSPRAWISTLREVVREHPDDPHVWYWLGETYYHSGSEMLVRPWEFVDAFERSAALDPAFAPAYEHLIDAAFQRVPDSARVATLIGQRDLVGDGETLDFTRASFQLAFGSALTSRHIHGLLQGFSSFQLRAMATHDLAHPRFLHLREAVLRTALERPTPSWERAIKAWLFWTLVARGHLEAAIHLTDDAVLAADRPTMLYNAHTFGYPIPEQVLARALTNAPTKADDRGAAPAIDWTSSTPSVFELGAYAIEHGNGSQLSEAKRRLRALIPTVESENATDTLRLQGLIEALDGYAAWQRGDYDRALTLLRSAQVSTIGGRALVRSVMFERNQIVRAWLGKLLLEMDRPGEALAYYESLGPGWPIGQDPMIYFHLGAIRDRLGDPDGAAEAYELAAVAWQDPDPELKPLAQTARREAKRLSELSRK